MKTNKSLGQHFLKNESIIQEICESNSREYDFLIEVGPGPATLTKTLATLKKPLYLIERDERFIEELDQLGEHVTVFHEDALAFDISKIASQGNCWLVSNLPYNISVPLLMKFLGWDFLSEMTLMFQKEVGDKIINLERSNALSICTHTQYKTRIVKRLKPGAFHPPPEVDSIVIHFTKLKTPLIPIAQIYEFKAFIQGIYNQKRKQIYKFVKQYFPENIDDLFEKYDINRHARAENLTITQLIGLFKEQ